MSLDRQRNFGLDLMRAIAVSCVLFAHGLMLAIPTWSGLLVEFVAFSVIGVELFFVLSGFLIGQLLFPVLQSQMSLRGFWLRRWFRTLPNYYLFLLINLVFYGCFFDLFPGSWRYVWFGQSLSSPSTSHFFSEAWSLAVEEWFYLLIPLLMLVLLRVGRNRGAVIPWSCAILIIVLPIARLLYIGAYHPVWDAGLRKITLLRLDSLMWGVLFAYLKVRHANFFALHARRFFVLAIVLLLPSLLYLYAVAPSVSANIPLDGVAGVLAALFFSVLPAGFACCLPLLQKLPGTPSERINRAINRISVWSYSLYLIHLPLLYTLILLFADRIRRQPILIAIAALGWLALALLLSAVNYRFFEKPTTNLRERWLVLRTNDHPL